ncbi:MAG: DUF1549 domain-containing protein [Chthonomonadaceae bacterium]|nr:DUF1549 domain-containing protein [Chthonomonadaceae bacterium]
MIISTKNTLFLTANVAVLALGFGALIGHADDLKTTSPAMIQEAKIAFFENKIRPMLADKCLSCHSGDHAMAELRLDTDEGWKKGGASGLPLFAKENPEKSLFLTVLHYDGKVKMPPAGKLSDKEIASVTTWVKMGASLPSYAKKPVEATKAAPAYPATAANFWSFRPVKKLPAPTVKASAWVKNPIDAFVLAKLEEKGLKPAPPADKRTLLRRVSLDLVGLPPTPQEMADFLNDKSPTAFTKVVDRLLASPHYGERWGRHWLDVARYADSNGQDENLAFSNAFRYRDYVIAAYNKDTPYNDFIKQQLAGDLMPTTDENLRNERLTATGFLSLGAKVLAEQDKPKMVMDIVDEQIEVTSKAFLGLTVACARCHNHKFDPIPTADYYALAGIFRSTKTMANLGFVSNWNERSLATKSTEAAKTAHQEKVVVAQKSLREVRQVADAELTRSLIPAAKQYLLTAWKVARQPGIFSRADLKPEAGEVRKLVEAETFIRGNALRNTETYGAGIGVIQTGSAPTFAEWDIDLPKAGNYGLELRYAAQESRPMKLSINGKIVREDAARSVTGSWNPDGQRWESQGVFAFQQGKNTVKIERDGSIPHLDKLILISVDEKTVPGGKIVSVEDIAKAANLIPALIGQIAVPLSKPENSPLFFPVYLVREGQKDAGNATPITIHFESGRVINPFVRANFEGKAFSSPEAVLEHLAELLASLPKDSAALSTEQKDFTAQFTGHQGIFSAPEKSDAFYSPKATAEVKTAEAEVKKMMDAMPTTPIAMAVDEGHIENCKIHIRGNHLTLGEEVSRHFLSVVSNVPAPTIPATQSGRLQLAEWIANPKNPLTGRVVVNRIWQDHFGAGLVRTPDNFGLVGERPSHPELLDWLSATFTDPKGVNWSQKKLHRLILLSSTYQQSVVNNPKASLVDPDNTLLWRMNRQRLQAEPLRDSFMATAGTLDMKMGGTLLITKNNDYVTNDQSGNAANYNALRRSVYLPIIRNALFDMFLAFDFGDPSMVNAKRATTTVAPQALYVMNSPFVMEQAAAFAQSLLATEVTSDNARIRAAYLRAYSRSAIPTEVSRSLVFLKRFDAALSQMEPDATKRRTRTWAMFCQTLFAANEFLYVD